MQIRKFPWRRKLRKAGGTDNRVWIPPSGDWEPFFDYMLASFIQQA
jgi:hypothetical protein